MFIVAGLGNPEKKYEKTRHNVGFNVIDSLADYLDIKVTTKRHRSLCGTGQTGNEKIILVKPQTYMNDSGHAIRKIVEFYKIDFKNNLIIVDDDVNLDVGRIRIRRSGSAGGHNGLKSIIANLKSDEFARIRVGVGINEGTKDLSNHVLGKFSKQDRKIIDEKIKDARDAIIDIIKDGIDNAMSKYNN